MIGINTPTKQTYNGDDSTSDFAIPFPVFEPEAVVITLINSQGDQIILVYKVDYDLKKINVLGLESSVTLLGGPLELGEQLIIEFNRQAFQPVNLRTLGAFAPVEIEKALDRAVMSAKRTSDFVDETFDDLQQLKLDVAQAQEDIVLLEGRADSLEDSVDNLSDSVDNLSDSVDNLSDSVDNLSDSVNDLSDSFNDLTDSFDDLIEDFTELGLEVASFEERIEDNENDIADIKRTQYEINTISAAGTYAANAGNLYVIRTPNAVVLQMPASPEIGDIVHIKSRASSNNISVNGNGNNVDGSGTFNLSSEDSSASIIFDGTEWLII